MKALARIKRTPIVLSAGLALLLLAACGPPPEFAIPLSEPGTAGFDERVLGTWYQHEPQDIDVHAVVTANDERTELRISLVFQTQSDAIVLMLSAFPSEVEGVIFYNLRRLEAPVVVDYTPPGEETGHIIVRPFLLTPDTLLVCVLLWDAGGKMELPKSAGLTARSTDVPLRLNGKPIGLHAKWQWRHTRIHSSREDLRRLVLRNPSTDFQAMYLLTRLGKEQRDPRNDGELMARMREHQSECNIDP